MSISILAVLADRDAVTANFPYVDVLFQSLRSLRTATTSFTVYFPIFGISILAVLADRDLSAQFSALISAVFQSLRSLRTATLHCLGCLMV